MIRDPIPVSHQTTVVFLPTKFKYLLGNNWLGLCSGMAIARRLVPFGVKRLLYSGRTAKAHAAEVNGEFGKKKQIFTQQTEGEKQNKIIPLIEKRRFLHILTISPFFPCSRQFPWTLCWLRATL